MVGDFGPDAVVNAAAMTNVDACERDPGASVRGERPRRAPPRGGRANARAPTSCTSPPTTSSTARPPTRTTSGPRSRRSRSTGARSSAVRSSSRGTRARGRSSARRGCSGGAGRDLVSWAFGAYERGELNGVLADSVSIPTYAPDLAELLAQFAVRAPPGPVPRHQRIRGGARATSSSPPRCRSAGSTPTTSAPITAILDRPARRPPTARSTTAPCASADLPGLRPWRDALAEYVKEWS